MIVCFLYDCNHLVKEFQDYQAILLLRMEQKIVGLVTLKEKKQGTFLLQEKEAWFIFFQEFSQIFKTAISMFITAHEEKRYKQLYRVTEKFHSSMSMDAVLREIISTLKNMYPTFDYYLLLSNDNNNHENLPIKDLEYDSENVAAMQAYVTGTVQFEDRLSGQSSVLHAPLKGKQGVYGVLQVISLRYINLS